MEVLGRVIIVAIVVDVAYQLIVFRRLYAVELVDMVLCWRSGHTCCYADRLIESPDRGLALGGPRRDRSLSERRG
jgi:hypothetical protein